MTLPGSAGDGVVRLEGLVRSFRGHLGIGRTVAVDGLDLDVRRGEIFGLIGPNGAGKTTTLKMMLGLLRPDRGSVHLFGMPPRDPRARARVGFLPENPYFYDYLTAREFLDFYARLRGIPRGRRRERIDRTLERVGLSGRDGVALRKFSKGMVQRVGLAQAILHDPDLVVLDEPMSGLDPIGRREVRDLILAIREAGRTVFFSSHILQDAEMICDRVAILRRGRTRAVGRLDEMVSGRIRWFEISVEGPLPADAPGERVAISGDRMMLRVPDVTVLEAVLAAARRAGAQVTSVWPRRETLEDLFLREMGREAGPPPADGEAAGGRP